MKIMFTDTENDILTQESNAATCSASTNVLNVCGQKEVLS